MKIHDNAPFPLRQLREERLKLRREVLLEQNEIIDGWSLGPTDKSFLPSVRNLAAYIALRRRDIRKIQGSFASLGLSSLGRSEPYVLTSIDAVLQALRLMEGIAIAPERIQKITSSIESRMILLESRTERLLGPMPRGRWARIMVTMSTEAAGSDALVRELLERGTDCARINCCHDSPDRWKAIISHINKAKGKVGRPCKILMDLAGPRIRTGPVSSNPGVLRVRPRKDSFSKVLQPGTLCLYTGPDPCVNARKDCRKNILPAQAPVKDASWLNSLKPGARVACRDLRGKDREFTVSGCDSHQPRLECNRAVYLNEGSVLTRSGPGGRSRKAILGPLVPSLLPVRLWVGDLYRLVNVPVTREKPGAPETSPPSTQIQCLPPQSLDRLKPGERVFIDDGKIGGEIRSVGPGFADAVVTHAHPNGVRILAEKGMNYPDSSLGLPSLGEKDHEDLSFPIENADIVGYSFIRMPEEMDRLVEALSKFGGESLGIIAKIENQSAFLHLLEIIVRGAAHHPFGVMIARGDLAVEIGYKRLAEVREEILWLCEAAHVPVIWPRRVSKPSSRKTSPPGRKSPTLPCPNERTASC
jgi:pyruvate kinase